MLGTVVVKYRWWNPVSPGCVPRCVSRLIFPVRFLAEVQIPVSICVFHQVKMLVNDMCASHDKLPVNNVVAAQNKFPVNNLVATQDKLPVNNVVRLFRCMCFVVAE